MLFPHVGRIAGYNSCVDEVGVDSVISNEILTIRVLGVQNVIDTFTNYSGYPWQIDRPLRRRRHVTTHDPQETAESDERIGEFRCCAA